MTTKEMIANFRKYQKTVLFSAVGLIILYLILYVSITGRFPLITVLLYQFVISNPFFSIALLLFFISALHHTSVKRQLGDGARQARWQSYMLMGTAAAIALLDTSARDLTETQAIKIRNEVRSEVTSEAKQKEASLKRVHRKEIRSLKKEHTEALDSVNGVLAETQLAYQKDTAKRNAAPPVVVEKKDDRECIDSASFKKALKEYLAKNTPKNVTEQNESGRQNKRKPEEGKTVKKPTVKKKGCVEQNGILFCDF